MARARDIQAERYASRGLPHIRSNAQASGPLLEEVAQADASGMALLRDAGHYPMMETPLPLAALLDAFQRE